MKLKDLYVQLQNLLHNSAGSTNQCGVQKQLPFRHLLAADRDTE
jgi:hypothetical protein